MLLLQDPDCNQCSSRSWWLATLARSVPIMAVRCATLYLKVKRASASAFVVHDPIFVSISGALWFVILSEEACLSPSTALTLKVTHGWLPPTFHPSYSPSFLSLSHSFSLASSVPCLRGDNKIVQTERKLDTKRNWFSDSRAVQG